MKEYEYVLKSKLPGELKWTKIGKYDKTGEEIKHLSKKGIKNFEKDYLKRGEPSAKTKIVKRAIGKD